MKNIINTSAQTGLCLFVLLLICLFVTTASAQKRKSKNSPPREQKLGQQMPEGYSLIDGDIQMPTWFVEAVLRGKTPKATFSNDLKGEITPDATFSTNLWTGGNIPFEFEDQCQATSTCTGAPNSGCVSAANWTAMYNAMAILEATANLNFQQCPDNNCSGSPGYGSYILIRDSTNDTTMGTNNSCVNNSRNSSAVGMSGGMQIINIVNWGTQYTIVHELMHALGFFHEQSRPDRSTYVTINCNNVQGGCNGTLFNNNFTIEDAAKPYGAYDFDSVMHYGQCAFTTGTNCPTDGTQTITVNPPWNTQWQNAIGQSGTLNHLSELDRAMVSFLYPQPGWRFLDCSYNGGNGASNGTIIRPYTTLADALAATPSGGTLWISGPCPPFPTGNYLPFPLNNNQITIRTAPNITASFGG